MIRKDLSTCFERNKKGQAQELLFYGVMLFVLGITIIIGFRLMTDLNDAFQSSDVISPQGKVLIGDFAGRFGPLFDAVYVLAMVVLSIVLIATVLAIDTRPIFFVLSVVAFLSVLMVNAILANVLDDIGRNSNLLEFYNQLPMMQFIGQHWLAIIVVVGFVTLMAFYTKKVAPG